MFNAHLDTYPVDRLDDHFRPDDRYVFGPATSSPESPLKRPLAARQVDENWLTGQELANMKTAMAGYLGAIDAVMRSGIRLKGDVILAGVVGADVTLSWTHGNPFPQDDEIGIGTRSMLDHGIAADMCVLGEPTSLGMVLAPLGRVRLKVSVNSTEPDPIDAMSQVVTALKEWIPAYQDAHLFHGVHPDVDLVAVQYQHDLDLAALKDRQDGSVYVEFRTIPGQRALSVIDEVRGVIRGLQEKNPNWAVVIEPLMIEPATQISAEEPVVQALQWAHKRVRRSLPETIYVGWSGDANRLNQRGIPTVIYGPGSWNLPHDLLPQGNAMNYQSIPDLKTATEVYALMVAQIGSRSRS